LHPAIELEAFARGRAVGSLILQVFRAELFLEAARRKRLVAGEVIDADRPRHPLPALAVGGHLVILVRAQAGVLFLEIGDRSID
jgi:hypothetical protein